MLISFRRIIFAFLCFILFCANLNAEEAFSLDLKTDIALSALSIGLFSAYMLIRNPPSQIPYSLNESDVNPLDRALMVNHYEKVISKTSDVIMGCLIAAPVFVVLGDPNKNKIITYSVMYTQALLLANGTQYMFKNNITRFRPYLHDGAPLDSSARHESFPSGHTIHSFMPAVFLSTTFAMEYPDSKWKWPVIIGSNFLAACVGADRILAGMHFFTDVLAGAAIGSIIGWSVPYLHKNRNSNEDFPIVITGNGFLVSFKF